MRLQVRVLAAAFHEHRAWSVGPAGPVGIRRSDLLEHMLEYLPGFRLLAHYARDLIAPELRDRMANLDRAEEQLDSWRQMISHFLEHHQDRVAGHSLLLFHLSNFWYGTEYSVANRPSEVHSMFCELHRHATSASI